MDWMEIILIYRLNWKQILFYFILGIYFFVAWKSKGTEKNQKLHTIHSLYYIISTNKILNWWESIFFKVILSYQSLKAPTSKIYEFGPPPVSYIKLLNFNFRF